MFFIILAFIAMLLIVAAFLPAKYTIIRTIEVNRSGLNVYNRIADLYRFKEWDPWTSGDKEAKNEIHGVMGQTGHSRTIKHDNREDKITFLGNVGLDSIFMKRETTSDIIKRSAETWAFEKTDNGTTVSWKSEVELSYPLGRFYGFFNKNQHEQEMTATLDKLKDISESDADQPPKPLVVPDPNIAE